MNTWVIVLTVIAVLAVIVLIWWLVASGGSGVIGGWSKNGKGNAVVVDVEVNGDCGRGSVGTKTLTDPSCSVSSSASKSVSPSKCAGSENSEFNSRYIAFYYKMIEYINNKTVETRKAVNDAIAYLSSIVCVADITIPSTLHMRKITILSEIFECDNTEIIMKKRADLTIISGELANSYAVCLKVDAKNLRKFFDMTDTLFILYNTSKDEHRRKNYHKSFMTLIDKLSLCN